MNAFIVALPLFDKDMTVQAYYLVTRSGSKLFDTVDSYSDLGDALISPALDIIDTLGVEPFAGESPLYIDVNAYQLLMDTLTHRDIPPEKLVPVVDAELLHDEQAMEKCRRLKDAGYSLALKGFPAEGKTAPNLNLFTYLMLDAANAETSAQLLVMTRSMRWLHGAVINVPDKEAYKRLHYLAGGLFTGQFYSRPVTKGNTQISPLKINTLTLLKEINEEDFDLALIGKTIERDPALSVSLLRYINSAAVGASKEIKSIRNAVAILGQREVRRWATVALNMRLIEDQPGEIAKLSLVRAKFAENLAPAYELGIKQPQLFMAGLFSLLDLILEKPMEEAIKEIAVPAEVEQALVGKDGPLFNVLSLIYAYEKGEWDNVAINMVRNGLEAEVISKAFLDALLWYRQLLDAMLVG